MKPITSPSIPHQRGEKQPAQKGIPAEGLRAVTLDKLIEYRLILRLVVDSLWAELLQEESEMTERRSGLARRIKEIEAFMRDVDDAPYDETRSIDLTHGEAAAAASGLVHNIDSEDMRPGEARLRVQLAAGINACVSWGLTRPDAVPQTTAVPLQPEGG